ncbi:MAG TPA: tRNA (adenosine(37)-N6)-threonylcarbamoyltransferase complex dimerization subunit type 1 TsaB [Candidatus Dormibacteraeota bacterium]|nr:tRNA (adenosine(37)-N6)-threonylcarbamoyltransferase complex dimerization subunit type 1 TsaB [Candidatus Dormibacteraeota bacterium]
MSGTPGWLLAMDTATATIVVAAGTLDGRLIVARAFEARYRHSQELLPTVVELISEAGLRLPDLAAIVVGTGPGAFTGLRVGLATAKTLAHELRVPVIGIASSDALLAAADAGAVLWLPSGPRDRLSVTAGHAPVVVPGAADASVTTRPGDGSDANAVAVDLDGRAPEGALARGRATVEALPASLVRLGAARLAAGDVDDPERLVPRYASAPRGAAEGQAEGAVAWSRDPR